MAGGGKSGCVWETAIQISGLESNREVFWIAGHTKKGDVCKACSAQTAEEMFRLLESHEEFWMSSESNFLYLSFTFLGV